MYKKISVSLIVLLAVMLFVPGYIPAGAPWRAGGIAFGADAAGAPPADAKNEAPEQTQEKDIKRETVRYAYSVGFPVLVLTYGFASWGWAKRDYWKFADEGWFGHTTRYGGFDKVGHVFSHYTAMRLSCSVYNYTERGSNNRFLYGALLTLLMGLSIEIGDAYSGYGFSCNDLVFDSIGILIGGLLEAFPKVDAFVSLSWEYWPSGAFRKHPGNASQFIDDYGGAKVLINIKLAGFREMGLNVPNFMRYIMVDVGYGVQGYTSFERHAALDNFRLPFRKQNLYVGISINFVEVIKDLFKDPSSIACRITQQAFKYYHVPVGYKHRFTVQESLKTSELN